ncbi:DUF1286 domain-containing protein [Sulfolobus acidocaldarius]|uniref:Conserved membrane protein n=5 Tax=Sulfolobus acidocaldarius TaxID=2285 RepID=Q4JC38_SULAC|nr:DUF1286 domain-containing protein [Sulfolobus acidocaldarius]AAY79641.1 conserved membrane protein [Sulfolobus acidocaldarius DSM 639]AGE70195.1 hypothetical protein SacN8_01070 [Sulfolobus acidocaldarius N8]AGE72470.1 hypothetical protein SacRon12I_01070 [Sulfolobus acidocaldarius Ron12/I]ALU29395.1 conjugal transfer protein [Sulfolobus acidocaldarius]ALU32123.1 conjugal transfer protein [Sulfolobus acidocaldarius]
MRLYAHYVFTIGVLVFINSFLVTPLSPPNYYDSLFYGGLLSVFSNTLIDRLGHEIRGKYISRTPTTHTFPRSMLWSLLVSVLLSFLFFYVRHTIPYYLLIDGVIAGPSHMVLDIFTERGIYVKRNGRWKRFALAHFRYNNPAVNGLAVLLGLLMMLVPLYL